MVITITVLFACTVQENNKKTQEDALSIEYQVLKDKKWVKVDQSIIYNNAKIDLLELNDKPGEYFYGWYLDKNFEHELKEDYLLENRANKNIVVYAKFVDTIQETYTVSFQLDGGEGDHSANYKFREKIDILSPSKLGYDFKGWYADEELTIKWQEFDKVRENITLYAKWEKVIFQITYELNGGFCNDVLQESYSKFNPLKLPDPSAFSKKGYDFENFYLDGEIFDTNTTYTQDLVIEIRWALANYDILYYEGDEQIIYDQNNPTTFNIEDKLILSAPTKRGYVFKGWYYSNEFTDENRVNFNNLPAQTIQLYPSFEELSFSINYMNMEGATNNVLNSNSYKYFDETISVEAPSVNRAGYDFSGWYLDLSFNRQFSGDNPLEDLTLYAKWTIINYSLTVVLNDGTYEGETPSTYNVETNIVLINPQKQYYVFDGWYLDGTFKNKFDLETIYTGNITLYAKWRIHPLLEATNYIEIPNELEQINVYKYTTKNICLTFDIEDPVDQITIPNTFALNYLSEEKNILVIDKEFFNDYVVGEKIDVDITFESGLKKRIYFTRINNNPYNLETFDYDLSSEQDYLIRIVDSSTVENLLSVTIDGIVVPYVYNAGDITIAKQYMLMNGVGKHLVKVYTGDSISSAIVNVTNDHPHVPYNVKIDLDSSFPNIYVTWDYDLTPDYIKVSFTGPQEYYSNEPTHQDLFVSNNKFDATNILKIKDTSCRITAYKDGNAYTSEQVLMPISLYESAASTTYLDQTQAIFAYPGELGEYGYTFYGKQNNFYITSMEEYFNLIAFMIRCPNSPVIKQMQIQEKDYNYLTVVLNIDLQARTCYPVEYTGTDAPDLTNENYVKAMTRSVYTSVGEKASISHAALRVETNSLNSNTMYKIILNITSDNMPGEYNPISNDYLSTEIPALNHYGSGLQAHEKLPIDSVEKTAYCQDSVQLYLALENGYRPIFDENNADVLALYQKIVTALRSIVDYNMNEYQIAIAIFEYIKNNNRYDQYVVSPNAPTIEQLHSYPCFFLEGVFNNKISVCNGIAIAYSCMLNMMGIKAEKIIGETKDDGHAWVKFCIAGEWYLADPTWGDPTVRSGTNSYEWINYNNLFITYKDSYQQGRIKTKGCDNQFVYEGDVYIDVFANMYYTYEGQKYDHIMESVIEYQTLLMYLKSLCEIGENMCTQIKAIDTALLWQLESISIVGAQVKYVQKGNTLMVMLTRTQ